MESELRNFLKIESVHNSNTAPKRLIDELSAFVDHSEACGSRSRPVADAASVGPHIPLALPHSSPRTFKSRAQICADARSARNSSPKFLSLNTSKLSVRESLESSCVPQDILALVKKPLTMKTAAELDRRGPSPLAPYLDHVLQTLSNPMSDNTRLQKAYSVFRFFLGHQKKHRIPFNPDSRSSTI